MKKFLFNITKIFLLLLIIIAFAFSLDSAKAVTLPVSLSYTSSIAAPVPGQTFVLNIKITNTSTTETIPSTVWLVLDYPVGDPSVNLNRYQIYFNCTNSTNGCDSTATSQPIGVNLTPGQSKVLQFNMEVASTAVSGSTSYIYGVRMIDSMNVMVGNLYSARDPFSLKIGNRASSTPTLTSTPATTRIPTTLSPTPTSASTLTVIPTQSSQILPISLDQRYFSESSKTTNLNTLNSDSISAVNNFTLDIPNRNTIVFENPLDLSSNEVINKINTSVNITETAMVSVDSQSAPFLNVPAEITMKGLKFNKTPVVLRNGSSSSEYVSNINYDSNKGILTFRVKGFSTYTAVDSAENTPSPSINYVSLLLIATGMVLLVTLGIVAYINRNKLKLYFNKSK